MKFLWWIVLGLVALVLVLFAVSNREMVSVGLWPLPDAAALPLYLVVLVCLLVGFFVGQLSGWIGGRHWRREAREARGRIAELERDLGAARTQAGAASLPAATLPR